MRYDQCRKQKTGTISYVHSATAGILPVNEKVEVREWGGRTVTFPMPNLSPKTFFLYKEGYNMDWYKVINFVATVQKHVDQGISFEYMMSEGYTTRDLMRLHLFAHKKGIKTSYYVRNKLQGNANECVACAV